MTDNDAELTAAGFKLTIVEKPRAVQRKSYFGKTYWIVYLKSTLLFKDVDRLIWAQGPTLEEAYYNYLRVSNTVIQMTRKT